MLSTNICTNNPNSRVSCYQSSSNLSDKGIGSLAKTISNSNIRFEKTSKGSHTKKLKSSHVSNSLNIKKISNEKSDGIIYSPFYNEDMVIQAVGINAARIIKGKQPLSVICSPHNIGTLKSAVEEVKKKELMGRLKNAEKEDELITSRIDEINHELKNNSLNLQKMFYYQPKEVKNIGEYRALNQFKVVQPGLLKNNSIGVIYIIGHGESGSPHFFATENKTSTRKTAKETMKEVASLLRTKVTNAPKIKVTSCESADRETIDSINNIPVDITDKKLGVAPLALTIKEEISQYFPKAKVLGYHGIGITRGYQYIGQTRCAKSDFDEETGKVSTFIKASSVKKEF